MNDTAARPAKPRPIPKVALPHVYEQLVKERGAALGAAKEAADEARAAVAAVFTPAAP